MSIKHYAIFRVMPPFQKNDVVSLFRQQYRLMEQEIPEICKVYVYGSYNSSICGSDILLEVELLDASFLPVYLDHPLHKHLMELTKDSLQKIASIDCISNEC
jgi:hypothetical protein